MKEQNVAKPDWKEVRRLTNPMGVAVGYSWLAPEGGAEFPSRLWIHLIKPVNNVFEYNHPTILMYYLPVTKNLGEQLS